MNVRPLSLFVAVSIVASAVLLAGCGGSSEEEEAASDPAAPAAEAEVAEGETPAEEEAPAEEESTTEAFVIDMSNPASPADYDAALRQQDFVKATDVVLRMDAQQVQGADTLNRMRELQDEVARAAANGDPKARQAAEMLRRIGRLPPSQGR